MKETLIKNQILDYLRYKNIFAFMVNTTGNYNKFTNSYYRNPRLMNGVADIICCINGRFIAIEVKNEKGKMSDSQKEFEQNVINNKGVYILARNLDNVINVVDNFLNNKYIC